MLMLSVAVSGQTDRPAPPDLAAPPANAEKSSSGLTSRVVTAGAGAEKPMETDVITVHYTGWSADGKMFDSSIARGGPSMIPLYVVMRGWRE